MAGMILCVLALGAAPPVNPTQQQEALLRKNFGHFKEAFRARQDGEMEEAISLLKQWIEIQSSVMGPWHRETALNLTLLAFWHRDRGQWKEEADCRRKVFEARRRLDGEGHPNTLEARLDMVEALAQARRTPAQHAAIKRGLALNRRLSALHAGGRFAEALPVARQALAVFRDTVGEWHPHYVASLNNVAALLQEMGDLAAALPLARRAVALGGQLFGHGHPSNASSLGNLAMLHMAMGDHEAALPLMKRSLALTKEANGERHPDHATSLNNLGLLHQMMGNHDKAVPLLERALAIRKEKLGRRDPLIAAVLNNLALVHQEMGNHDKALPLYKQALALIRDVSGMRHPDYAAALNNLAALHESMGELKAALPLYERALALNKELLGENHPRHATTLNSLAMLHSAMGDRKAALALSEQALALTRGRLADDAAELSDRQQLAAIDDLRHRLDARLSLVAGPDHAPAAAHVLAWKGSLLLRQQQRRLYLRLADDPEAREAAQRLQSATRRLAALRLSPTAARRQLDGLHKEQEDAQAALAKLSAGYRAQRARARPDSEALAASLPRGAVLIDYHTFIRYGRKGKGPHRERRVVVFLHRKGQPAARLDLEASAADIEEAVREWRTLLQRGKPEATVGAAVKKLIWTPLAKHLEGANLVLISPDGILGTVPFAALPGSKAGTYLIEDVALAIVPVPSLIPDLLRPVLEKESLAPSLLVVGGVDYEMVDAPASSGQRGAPLGTQRDWGSLPGTVREADAVGKAFAARFKARPVALSGTGASKKAVSEGMAKARYVHLATHGYFSAESVKSALDGRSKQRLGEATEPAGWHPLLLSGLALAGANREPRPGEDDGILTALEVSEMDLTGLELAVLSACETGLGMVAGGEGVLGMQRAFQTAGARSVIATLWKVDDRATQQLMSDFYSIAWDAKKSVSRVEALRRAQLAMMFGRTLDGKPRGAGELPEKITARERRLPPYYWAPFVLSGDWR